MDDKRKNDGGGGSGALAAALKLLDKAAEYDWTLQFAGAFLFVDAAMVIADKRNFLNWDWSAGASAAQIGFAITAFLVYGLCASLIIPFINASCQSVVLMFPVLYSWTLGESRYKRPDGYVRESELQDRADEEQSSYLQDKLDRANDARSEATRNIGELGRISLTTLVFFVANLFVVDTNAVHTATGLFLSAFDPDHRRTAEMLIVGILLLPVWYAWTYEHGPHWIPYRPLYDEIVAKQSKRK